MQLLSEFAAVLSSPLKQSCQPPKKQLTPQLCLCRPKYACEDNILANMSADCCSLSEHNHIVRQLHRILKETTMFTNPKSDGPKNLSESVCYEHATAAQLYMVPPYITIPTIIPTSHEDQKKEKSRTKQFQLSTWLSHKPSLTRRWKPYLIKFNTKGSY